MAEKLTPLQTTKNTAPREDRLKAALKANLARRKAQTRERAVKEVSNEHTPGVPRQDKET